MEVGDYVRIRPWFGCACAICSGDSVGKIIATSLDGPLPYFKVLWNGTIDSYSVENGHALEPLAPMESLALHLGQIASESSKQLDSRSPRNT